jgi:hypothetical protein
LACAVSATGCATVGLSDPVVTDRVTATPQRYEPRDGVVGTVSVQSTRLQVDASKSCDLVEKDQIARNTVRERRNETPAADWLFFAGGVLAAGTGTVLLIDSSSTYATDKNSTTYNPYGPGTASALGLGLIGLGAALLVVPTVDLFRAAGKVEKNETVEGPPRTVRERVACPLKPADGSAVTVAVGGLFQAGKIGADGKLIVNLVEVVPVGAVTGRAPTTATVAVDGTTVGTVPTGPLRAAHEEAAWKALDRSRCSEPSSVDGCVEVLGFMTAFPAGAHEPQGRELLTAAEPKLERLRDDKDWTTASSSACARPKEESACEGVDRYLAERPAGIHATDAKKLTRDAGPVLSRLRAQREAREQARERAEAQRQAAEAAQAGARERQACVAECGASLRGCKANCAGLPGDLLADCHLTCTAFNQSSCLKSCR